MIYYFEANTTTNLLAKFGTSWLTECRSWSWFDTVIVFHTFPRRSSHFSVRTAVLLADTSVNRPWRKPVPTIQYTKKLEAALTMSSPLATLLACCSASLLRWRPGISCWRRSPTLRLSCGSWQQVNSAATATRVTVMLLRQFTFL